MTTSIYRGDLLAWFKEHQWLVENGYIKKAHAVLCDPPYALPGGFMNAQWDNFNTPEKYQAWCTEWGRLLLSFVYPGAVMLCFGGPRTYHRLAAGLEDAGWIVADCLQWVTAQGFPKSLAIGKAIDREAGAKREIIGTRRAGIKRSGRTDTDGGIFVGGLPEDEKQAPITAPATESARQWEGHGTALAPAYEPILVCRAPWTGTYAGIAQEYGTGALWIDGARIGVSESDPNKRCGTGGYKFEGNATFLPYNSTRDATLQDGRWPKNLILGCDCESDVHRDDCAVAIIGEQTEETENGYRPNRHSHNDNQRSMFGVSLGENTYNDTGTAARFFKVIKTSPLCVLCSLPIGVESSIIHYQPMEDSQCQSKHVDIANKNSTPPNEQPSIAPGNVKVMGSPVTEGKNQNNGGGANTAESGSKNTSQIGTPIAHKNVQDWQHVKSALNVRFAGRLCNSCAIVIAQKVVAMQHENAPADRPGPASIAAHTWQILSQSLVQFVESLESTDTMTTTPILNGLLGFVGLAIENIIAETSSKFAPTRLRYIAKAARWERESGLHERSSIKVNDGRDTPIDNPYQRGETKRLNIHNTVKPIRLTEYLARLILPPTLSEPRRLLVPFSGSGSEMIGAQLAGWDNVTGFEQSDDYADIAQARIAWWAQFSDYDMAKRAYDADLGEQKQRDTEAAHGLQQLALFAGGQ